MTDFLFHPRVSPGTHGAHPIRFAGVLPRAVQEVL